MFPQKLYQDGIYDFGVLVERDVSSILDRMKLSLGNVVNDRFTGFKRDILIAFPPDQ